MERLEVEVVVLKVRLEEEVRGRGGGVDRVRLEIGVRGRGGGVEG